MMMAMAMLLLAVEMAVAVMPQPESLITPDTLSRRYRHIEAVKYFTTDPTSERAEQLWRGIVEEEPDYAPALYYLSRIASKRGTSSEALKYARRAYEVDSTNKWYVQNYGAQLIDARRFSDALPIYRRIIDFDNQNTMGYYSLAILYDFQGMPYSAIATLDSATVHIGRDPRLEGIKVELLLNTRNFDRAIEESLLLVNDNPYLIDGHILLGRSYEASGRDSLALATYNNAYRIDSTDIATLSAISDYHIRRGNIKESLKYDTRICSDEGVPLKSKLDRVNIYTYDQKVYGENYFRIGGIITQLTIDYPTDRRVVEKYASHLIAGGELEAALEYMLRHLDDESSTAEDNLSALQLIYYLKRHDIITEELERAEERYPDNVEILSFLGFVFGEMGSYDRAIETFEDALTVVDSDKERSTLWGYIGDMYDMMGKATKSYKAYDKALKFNPDNESVLNNYAYHLSLIDKNLDKALEMSERAIKLDAGNYTFIDTYAWVLHRLGRNDEAKQHLRHALSLCSQRDADILAHYGDVLWALGEEFMADTYWKKAVEQGFDAEEMEIHRALKHKEKRP